MGNRKSKTPAVTVTASPVVTRGPERTYNRRIDSNGRGVGFWPTAGNRGDGMVWTEGIRNAPYAEVPAVGATMTLCATSAEVPGHTLHFASVHSTGRLVYRCGARKVVIHPAAMPTVPDGMTADMLLCSLPLVAVEAPKAPTVTPKVDAATVPPVDAPKAAKAAKA